jgi:hypothetical protein
MAGLGSENLLIYLQFLAGEGKEKVLQLVQVKKIIAGNSTIDGSPYKTFPIIFYITIKLVLMAADNGQNQYKLPCIWQKGIILVFYKPAFLKQFGFEDNGIKRRHIAFMHQVKMRIVAGQHADLSIRLIQ